MTKMFVGGVAALAAAFCASTTLADFVLEVDITNPNAAIFRTTGGASSVTAGGQGYAVVLAGFLVDPPNNFGASLNGTFGPASGALFTFMGGYTNVPAVMGFGLYGFNSPRNYTAGQQAFTGSSTGSITMIGQLPPAGRTGDVLLRDDFGRLTGDVIGQYRIVPTPSSLALLGLGGLAVARRRR